MFQYENELAKENLEKLEIAQHSAQKALNSRLGDLRIRAMSAADFDAMEQHSVNDIVFVNRNGEIELYKGSVLIDFQVQGGA